MCRKEIKNIQIYIAVPTSQIFRTTEPAHQLTTGATRTTRQQDPDNRQVYFFRRGMRASANDLSSRILRASCFSTINKLDVSTKMYSGGPVLERDENERKQILKSKIQVRAIIPTLNILIKTIGNSDGPDESYCKRPLKSKSYARAVISTINKFDVSKLKCIPEGPSQSGTRTSASRFSSRKFRREL